MRMRLVSAVCLFQLSIGVTVASSAPITFRLDPVASRASFTLGATLHTVHGELAFERGWIRFDPATGEAEGEVVFDARRTRTGNETRDATMHREVLESERFSDIVFVPSRVEGELAEEGTSELQVRGEVRLHGGSHEVAFGATAVRSGRTVQATARVVVPYVAWGLQDPSMFLLRVAKEVEVTIEVRGGESL